MTRRYRSTPQTDETGASVTEMCLYSAGTEDKRAGGISQQVPERAAAGQRLKADVDHLSQDKRVSAVLFIQTTLSEKFQEGDYDVIADDPSLPASSEAGRVTALVGEAGRSCSEVNTPASQQHSHRMNPRLPAEHLHFQPPSGLPDQEFSLFVDVICQNVLICLVFRLFRPRRFPLILISWTENSRRQLKGKTRGTIIIKTAE